MEMNCKTVERELTVSLAGELDHHGAREAIRTMERAIECNLPRRMVLDLSRVSFMDSSGIAVLLRGYRRVTETGGTFRVMGVPEQARRVLDAAGVSRLIDIS